MIWDYFLFSYNSIKKRKLRSYLTMIGIFIGIAAVVSLISLAQGMQDAIKSQFASFGSDAVTIQAGGVAGYGPPGTAVVSKLTEHDEDVIKRVNGVSEVASRLIRSVKLESQDEVIFAFVASVPDEREGREIILELNDYKVDMGRFFKSGDRFKVVIGDDFATRNRFKKNLNIRDKILIEGTEVEIIGKLKRKGNPQQDSTILISDDSLREILNLNDDLDIIVAKIIEGSEPSKISDNIENAMRRDRHLDEGKEDFQVQTAENVIASLNTILAVVQWVLVGIAGISLVVGGIGIMNTMYTTVLERTREIGIMKAIGAKNSDIGFLFLIESGMLGFTGGAIGVIMGIVFSKTVEFTAASQLGTGLLQANASLFLIFGALSFSFLIGGLSGILPAYQASRLKPIEALRKR